MVKDKVNGAILTANRLWPFIAFACGMIATGAVFGYSFSEVQKEVKIINEKGCEKGQIRFATIDEKQMSIRKDLDTFMRESKEWQKEITTLLMSR